MATIYYESEAPIDALKGKKVLVLSSNLLSVKNVSYRKRACAFAGALFFYFG